MTRTRERIGSGIYRDQYGLAATVKVAKVQREKRFPLDHPIKEIERWQARIRGELEEDRADEPEGAPPARGTFEADLPRYLLLIVNRVGFKSDRSHLRAWVPHVGHLPRGQIRPSHVRAAFSAWLQDGKSARTIRHRRRVLRELYQALDGVHAKPPIKGVAVPRPEDPHPTPVPIKTIQKVAKSLKKGKRHKEGYGDDSTLCYARFLVRATTGQRPTQIMRATPGDVDLKRRIWFVRAAKRGHPIPLPLTPDMIKAWKTFIAAKAWGSFDTRSFSKTIRRHGWPKGIRPYNLRHTFAIDHLLNGTELGDLQGLLGHRQIETTRKFYGPILLARLRKASTGRKLKLA